MPPLRPTRRGEVCGRVTISAIRELYVPELRAECQRLGLLNDGLKAVLVERLFNCCSRSEAISGMCSQSCREAMWDSKQQLRLPWALLLQLPVVRRPQHHLKVSAAYHQQLHLRQHKPLPQLQQPAAPLSLTQATAAVEGSAAVFT